MPVDTLVKMALAVAWVTTLVVRSRAFGPIRDILSAAPVLGYIVTCLMCTSAYLSLVLVLFYRDHWLAATALDALTVSFGAWSASSIMRLIDAADDTASAEQAYMQAATMEIEDRLMQKAIKNVSK